MIRFLSLLSLGFLAACGTPEYDHRPILHKTSFADLHDWENDNLLAAYHVFQKSCKKSLARRAAFANKQGQSVGALSGWKRNCSVAENNNLTTNADARAFFETYFTPHRITTRYSENGRFTGYYEPVISGSFTRTNEFSIPVYGVPYNHTLPSFSRAQIDAGALRGKAPVLLYVNDPVPIFFLHIQGSGKVQLPDGRFVSLQYADKNGHGYVPIGRVLKDRGALEEVSLQTIRDWLYRHPHQAQEVLQQNPSYVFFNLAAGDAYPKGALGVPLTPGRSLAIDDDQATYGLPVYISTEIADETPNPFQKTPGTTPFSQLMIAQDTGGAILGAHRGDIFFGRGKRAEFLAGYQNALGKVHWLLPKE